MVDAGFDGCNDELDGFFLREVFFVVGLEHCHGRQRARTSRVVGTRVHVAVVRALDQLRTLHVNSSHDQMSANVTSVLESMGDELESCHLDSVLRVGVKSVQLQLALDHLYLGSKFG